MDSDIIFLPSNIYWRVFTLQSTSWGLRSALQIKIPCCQETNFNSGGECKLVLLYGLLHPGAQTSFVEGSEERLLGAVVLHRRLLGLMVAAGPHCSDAQGGGQLHRHTQKRWVCTFFEQHYYVFFIHYCLSRLNFYYYYRFVIILIIITISYYHFIIN